MPTAMPVMRSMADDPVAAAARRYPASSRSADIRIEVHANLAEVEESWREFQAVADGTVFQTFEWLSTWHRCVGAPAGVRCAIVTGHDAAGLLFLLPFAIERAGGLSVLTWLGSDLCDYNAPWLAPDFSARMPEDRVPLLLEQVFARLRTDARFRYDLVRFEKMPARVGAQANPLLHLACSLNPSGAHMTRLGDDWESYYKSKRSASTRQRDRSKRKRLAEIGQVAFVTPETDADIAATLDTLIAQKAKSFAARGITNIFARRGYRAFFHAIACEPVNRAFSHVSRLDVGADATAVNLGLVFRDCYYHVLASYTEGDMSRLGPGTAHLHDLMRYAIGRGCRIYDFTIGDEGYKRDWCEIELELYDYISPATLPGVLAAAATRLGRALKRWIKQTPALWRMATRTREALAVLRRGRE